MENDRVNKLEAFAALVFQTLSDWNADELKVYGLNVLFERAQQLQD